MRIFLALLIILSSSVANAQSVQILDSSSKISIRGLSVVDNKVIWISGSRGTVGRSVDGGKTWAYLQVKGHEKRDFRDIEAFDKNTAVIIAVAEPAIILKTSDGGKNWKEVYRNEKKGMFLDAMEFWNINSGIVLGDPIDGRMFVARTFDGGDSWKELPVENLPEVQTGEACFAASGTNIRALDLDEACFVTGGTKSRFFSKGKPTELDIVQGKETTGANSVAILDWKKRKGGKHIYIVGGDFAADTSSYKNSVYSHDGGKTWMAPSTPPKGYKSSVEFISKNNLVTCGTSGVDISNDGGNNWKHISSTGFHVVRKAKKGDLIVLAGGNGRIAVLKDSF
jgi:photosystem II stability/assembly factor-like uncharacterized protein